MVDLTFLKSRVPGIRDWGGLEALFVEGAFVVPSQLSAKASLPLARALLLALAEEGVVTVHLAIYYRQESHWRQLSQFEDGPPSFPLSLVGLPEPVTDPNDVSYEVVGVVKTGVRFV